MVTVEADEGEVEQRLTSGGLTCPGCSAVLAGWGHARARAVRDRAGSVAIRPRRSRCTGCGVTHVLLPVFVLVRRADTAAVIGAALAAKAAGAGQRRIAALLGRPVETVRGWLRRFGARLEPVRAVFTWWCRALAADPVLPGPAGSAWADTLAAIIAAAVAVRSRFGNLGPDLAAGLGSDGGYDRGEVGELARWEIAVAVSAGRLLAPGWPGSDSWSGSTRAHPAVG